MISLLTVVAPSPAVTATTERVVQDRHSGLAIGGIDPVAYFTDAQPLTGHPVFETSEQGAVWRFRNESNLTSFKARPDIYGPQFGGHDPVDIARGIARAGNPRIWLIAGQRLYLFSREDNRDAFAAQAGQVLNDAGACWPRLLTTLAQ